MFPGININREIDSLLEIGYDVTEGGPSSISNDATTSQTGTSRARDDPTLSMRHSINCSFVSTPFASRVLQAIRLTDITSASPTVHNDYESDSTWKGGPPDSLPQYYGSSSAAVLAHNVRSYLSPVISEGGHFRSEHWLTPSVESRAYANDSPRTLASLRADIPSGDLLFALIDGYFERVNIVFPILHRPLFESQLRDNLHAQDGDFMRLLLVVCAVGARWCKDPGALDDQWESELSAGYRWFRSAYKGGINVLYRPSLVNVQFMVLSLVFLLGTSFHDMTWLFAAKASRMFEALGLHRRKQSRTLADELMKRAFRCHFILECFASTTVGKPSTFQNTDVDVDDVMEIDDLQWAPDLHAPPPSSQGSSLPLAALNHTYRLYITVSQALHTVFAQTSVKRQIGLGSSQGEEWIVRSLNQQLNRWPPVNFAIAGVFSSAMILIIDSIMNSPTGHPREDATLYSQGYSTAANGRHLKICSATLESLEKYYHIAGRLNDVMKEFQDFWTSCLAAQSTRPSECLDSHDPRAARSLATEDLESPRLYAQPPPGVPTLAWEQSTGPYLTTQIPGLFEMGIPSISFSQTHPVSNPTSIPNELQSSPYDARFMPEEWMLNIDDILVPGGVAYDLVSLPPEPGNLPSDWSNTMESLLRLNEGESRI